MAIWVQNKLIKLPSSCSLCEAGCNDAAIHMLLYMLANLKYMSVHGNAIYSNPNPMRATPSPRNEPATEKYPGHMHKNTQIKNMRNGWSGLTQKKQMQKLTYRTQR